MKYNTIVIDPPWPIKMQGHFNRRPNRATNLPYKSMTIEEIKTFPIQEYAEPGAHIYLWTTNSFLKTAFEVLEAWRIRYHMTLPYIKGNGMVVAMGYKSAAEFCLLGFYGKPMKKWTGIAKLNWIKGNVRPGKHSYKPDEFYELVQSMSPGPRIDIFSRKKRNGWDQHGDECNKFN